MLGPNEMKRPGKAAAGQKAAWCPFAKIIEQGMPTQGPYRDLHPRGAIVHYTAACHGGPDEITYGRKMGYAYMVIDRAGVVYQAHPFTRWGYHAGESAWAPLGTGVSRSLVGIEVESWGLLTATAEGPRSWAGTPVPQSEARLLAPARDNQHPGMYHAYTAEQERSLGQLLMWLKNNAPDIFDFDLVLGHDEVAPNRKEDPGGALSMTMPDLRSKMKLIYGAAVTPGG